MIESHGVPAAQWFVILRFAPLGELHAVRGCSLVGRGVVEHPVGARLDDEARVEEPGVRRPSGRRTARRGRLLVERAHVRIGRVRAEKGGSGVSRTSFVTNWRMPTSGTGSQIARERLLVVDVDDVVEAHVVPVRSISIAPR